MLILYFCKSNRKKIMENYTRQADYQRSASPEREFSMRSGPGWHNNLMKRFVLTVAFLLSCLVPALAQVSVSATGGTTTGSYATVNAAFAAINAGTHTGSITINETANNTAPATPTPLLASGTASSSYTAVTVKPSTSGIIINGNASQTAGRGIIELQGADNVTIDGSSNGTTSKDLTIQAATSTSSNNACIRLSSNSTTGADGANNNTVKNCIIIGSRASATSTVANFGIVFSNAAAAITTSTGAYSSTNTVISDNNITRCYHGIYAQGTSATYPNTGTQITGNVIGTPVSGTFADATTIGARGIYLSYTATSTSGAIVRGNDVRVGVTSTGYGATIAGIEVATSNYGIVIDRNNIHDISQPSSGGYGAHGLYITGSTNNTLSTITNNIIRDCSMATYQNSSTSAFIPTGVFFTAGATNVKFVNNTISMPAQTGGSTYSSFCVNASVSGVTFSNFLNNILINNHTSSAAYGFYTAATANISAGTVNNNNYYVPNGVVGYYNAANRNNLAAWQSATSKDGNSYSTAITFTSATNLHIPAGTSTVLESGGASVATTGVSVDYDNEARPGPSGSVNGGATAPDIGADEFDGTPAVPCTTPGAATATAITTASSTATSIAGTITAPATAPTGYLVVYSTSATLSAGPVDGTAYSAGTALGGGTVGYAGTATSYTISSLTSNTNYYVFVYSYNSGTCLAGPKYSATSVTANAVTCAAAPTALAASTTNNSASVSWTASATGGGAASITYTLQLYSDSGYATLLNTYNNVTSAYVISGLTANTIYYYRLTSSNGSCGTTATGNFTTQLVTPVTWTEGFTTTTLPTGWTNTSTWTIGATGGVTGNPGNNIYKNLYSSTTTASFTTVNIGPLGSNDRLKFDWKTSNFSSPYGAPAAGSGNIVVEISTNYGSSYTTLATFNNDGTSAWRNNVLSLSAYAGQNVKLRFTGNWTTGSGADYDLAFDNFIIEPTPACSAPTNVTVGVVSESTAAVSWTAPSPAPANGYEYYISTTNTAPTAATGATGTVAAGTTNTVFTSLNQNTTYYFWLRSVCSGADISAWSSSGAFTTQAVAPVTWTEGFTTTTLPTGWTNTGFTLGSARGVTGNPGNNIYKNLYSGATTGNFTIINVGPLGSNDRLKFDWKTSNYSSPYDAPAAGSGNFVVEISTNYGNTYTTLATVSNDGTAAWHTNTYDLSAYDGEIVKLRITGNWTTGSGADYDLALDNFIIEPTPTCEAATAPITGAVTNNSVSVSWTASVSTPASGYEYYVSTTNTAPTAATTATGSVSAGTVTATITSLSANTTYFWWVRAVCSTSDKSTWTAGSSFTTLCDPVASINENFDSATTPALPSCWTKIIRGATVSASATVGTSTTAAITSPNTVNLYNSNSNTSDDIMLVTPLISNLTDGLHQVRFNARNNATDLNLEVGVITGYGNSATFTVLQTITLTTTMTEYTVPFTTYTGSGNRIALRMINNTQYSNIYIDDFKWELVPTCYKPTGVTVSATTTTSATFNWTAPTQGTPATYEYEIRSAGAAGSGSTGIAASGSVTAPALTATASGLQAATTYTIYMRTNCGGSDNSEWTNGVTFTTLCNPVTSLPWTENFDGMTTLGNGILPTCWSNSSTNSTYTYTSANASGNTYNDPRSTPNYLTLHWLSGSEAYLWTPGFQLNAGESYTFSYYWAGDAYSGWAGEVYSNTAQVSTGATQLGAAFVAAGTTTGTSYTLVTRTFVPTTTGVYYFGIRTTSDSVPYYLGFDDFSLVKTPSSITSFTPSSVCSVGGTNVTITGVNLNGATSVKFNGVDAASYTVANNTTINAVTPAGLTAGSITVVTPSNTATSSTNFTVTTNPTVPAITGGEGGFVCLGTPLTLSNTTTGGVWTTSNDAVATVNVSTGVVTGVAPGIVTISYTVTTNGCATTRNQALTVITPPSIGSSSGNQTLTEGATATYTVTASGDITGYQWQINTGSGWNNITNDATYSGATTSALTISNLVNTMNNNQYRVIVSGSAPCVQAISTPAYLYISTIGITSQPVDVTLCSTTTTASYSVSATGTGLTYQWQVNTGSAWSNLSGETSSTLNLSGITTTFNGYKYRVIITDSNSTTATSSEVNLTVNEALNVTSQPSNQTACFGSTSTKTFTAAYTGTATGIQWQYSANGTSWAALTASPPAGVSYSGGASNTLTVNIGASTPIATYYYRAVIGGTSPCGDVTTNTATLSVYSATITATASSSSYCTPGTGVTLTATGGSTYVWSPAAGLSATTGASVIATPSATTTYTVTGTDANGCVNTATVTVTVNATPGVTASTSAAAVCSGQTVTLSAVGAVAFTTGNVSTYGFAASTGATIEDMSSATTIGVADNDDDPYTASNIGFTFNYNGVDYTQFSASPDGFITLGSATAAAQYTNDLTSATNPVKIAPYWDDLALGDAANGGYIKYVVTGTAPNRICKIEWFVTIPRNITGTPSSKFQLWLYESTNAIDFRYGTMGSATSSASVGIRGTGTTNFQSVTISSNTAAVGTANNNNALQPAAGTKYTFTPVQPTLSYAWTSIPAGFTSTEQNPTATVTANTTYVVTATASNGCTATASVAVTNNTPVVADITGNTTGSMCTSATLDLDSATTGGVWSTSNDTVATVDASTGVVTGITQGTVTITYTVTANGCSNSKTTSINVYVAPAITSASGNQTVTPGSSATYSVNATGSNLAYQWQVNTGSGWTNIADDTTYSGTATATLTVSNPTVGMNGYQYRATVSGSAPCSAVNSNPASLIISDIGITAQPENVTICSTSTTASFSVTATGTGLTYQWQVNTGSGWTDLTGETAPTLSLTGITTAYNGYQYHVIITDATATTATSSTATLTVNSPAVITTQATSQGVCFGASGSKTFTIVRSGAEAIQWQYSANGTSGWANVASATPAGVTYTGITSNALIVNTSATTAAGVYYFRAVIDSASPCDDTVSSVVTLTVSQPSVTATASASTYCNPGGTGVTLSASGAVSYTWSPATGLSATTGASVIATPSANTTYTVTGTNEFGCTATATVTVTVSNNPSAIAVAAASEVCSGGTVQLDVNSAVAFTTPAISTYQFTSTTGTYTPVSSSATSVAVLADSAFSAALPIGFTFNYGGNNYTQFKMTSDGFITLNTAQTSTISGNNLSTANANARPIIAPLWDDHAGSATAGSYAGYELTGTAPNRVLTVEWRNWLWNYSATTPVISFQVKLYEGTNNIEFTYRTESGSISSGSASIGLGAPTGNGSGSYLALSSISTPAVSSTTNTTSLSTKPATGTVYRFSPGNAPALTYAWTSVPAGFTSSVKNPVATVNANTTYYVTVTAPSGCATTSNVTVNTTSGVNITTQPVASTTLCQGNSFTLTVVATGPGLTYQWRKGGNNITGATSSSYTVTNAAVADSANYDVVITPTCGSAVTSNVATVLVNPTPTVTAPSTITVCAGATVSAITLSGSPSGVTYDITGGAAVGLANQTNVTSIPSFTAASTSTSAVVTITPKANGCTGTPVSFSITVSSLPSTVSIATTGTPLCNGTVATLTASGGSYTNTLYSETFDALPSSYVTGGTTPSATLNTTYYAQGTGSLLFTHSTTSATATYALNSNVNLTGYASAQLTFNHIAALEGPSTTYDIAYVQYSTDGGTTWSYFPASSYAGAGTLVASSTGVSFSTRSYADWISQFTGASSTPGTGPATSLWKQETINIPVAALTNQFRLRFTYSADSSAFYYGWLIDNVKITGTGTSAYTWSPTTNLFTDPAATTAYTGDARATVYAKPTANTTYTATATTTSGCTSTANVTVTVNASSAPSAADQQFCAGATVANLVATGSNIQWYSAATGGSPLAGTTALTPATYYASQTVNGCESARTAVVVTLLSSWTGAVSSDWANPANWCGNTIPTTAVDVIIPAVTTLPVITTGNTALAHNLTLSANATLTVQTGATLSVDNILAVNPSATLTVQNNGALIQGAGTVVNPNSGNIVFTKNGSLLYRNDYTMWSSPVTGQNLEAFSPATVSTRFYTYNPATDQYARVTAADNSFAPAKGYLIRMPDNYPLLSGYYTGATPVNFVGTFTGAPNNGTVNYTLSTAGNGFNSVGNPYPSPINLAAFFAANSSSINASSGIYLWRKKNNGSNTSYATLTLAAYTANPATGGGSENSSFYVYDQSTGSNNWLIAPAQGFIVKTNATSGSPILTFTNAMRRPTPGTSQSFFRQQADTNSRMWINMTAANGMASQTAIAYMNQGTLGMDYGYDGEKFTDANTLAVYSIAESKALAVQARPQFNNTDIVPVGFFAPTAGTYTLSMDHVDGVFANGQTIYLRDNVEGVVRNLSNNSYTFATEAGTFDNRFEVLYTTEALGTNDPTINPDNVVVYKEGTTIQINTGSTIMNGITVYDIRGRRIYSASDINNTQTAITNLTAEQQVLIVEIDTVKGKVSKRIIY